MNGNTFTLEIDRDKVITYFYWWPLLVMLLGLIWFCGAGAVLALLYAIFVRQRLSRWIVNAMDYRLEGTTLCVDSGVIFLRRKRIPLDRITDLVLSQGPLARRCGIWILKVQTAGTGQPYPEATLFGLRDPENVRDEIIAARDAAVGNPAQDA